MKESKAVYVTKYKIRNDHNLVYQLYAKHNGGHDTNNIGCQYDSKKDNIICTCRNISSKRPQDMTRRYFSGVPKQIYAYHGRKSFTDIGVGSVKALQRRKVKKVYLPETNNRGVGSSDLSSFISRKSKQQGSYYDHKIKSSKCVGGFIEYISVISQKLSPIVQTKSGSTSPKMSIDQKNIEIGSNTVDKSLVTIGTQFEVENKELEEPKKEIVKVDRETEPLKKSKVKVSEHTQKYKYSTEVLGKPIPAVEKKVKEDDKVYSSDSLVQHVHNLENPSDEKPSRASIDPMENKLEREYRRMFSTKERDSKPSIDKPIPEFKSASILRRRFEALRKGLVKKDEGKKNNMPSSEDTVPSRIDVSVTSDPPSLEGRSFTDTKKYSPVQTNIQHNKSPTNNAVNNAANNNATNNKTNRNNVQWPQNGIDSECQGVKGMFNLWGKKFKFEDEPEKTKPKLTPMPSLAIDFNKKPQKTVPKKPTEPKVKGGRKFFFFKKKSKDQKKEKPKEVEKKPYNPSGVTAGRCEIKDGLTLKLATQKDKVSKMSIGDDIQRKTWFKDFLTNITSAKSVNVRWNNSMYATSSSTVFELMDTIYKNNGVVIKSRSEITSEESSYYRSYTKNKVNFDQKIEAWMIPNTIRNKPKEIPVRILSNKEIKGRDVGVTMSDQKWFIEKCKAFANKIEVVLHSTSFNKVTNKDSSEYLKIDIPKDFFDTSSSDDNKQDPTSDEEVYKIVEYESDMNTKKALDKGDHASEIKVIVNVQDSRKMEPKILETIIKKPPMHRDVVIQGSTVNIPKRCDVIGVGIITQRDMREIKKPILKIQDYQTDDDSEEGLQANQKKSEFAESYLQEYYRHSWTPQGIDLFSWCVSDSHVRSSSEKSTISFQNQGDQGSKSCPNICEDFHATTIVSPCETSSCSQCNADEKLSGNNLKQLSMKYLKKCKIPFVTRTDTDVTGMKFLPKDSLEVFRRRKIYASSLKSKWGCSDDIDIEDPVAALSDQDDDRVDGILRLKGAESCKKPKCPKHAVLKTSSIGEIHHPPCKPYCLTNKHPACEQGGVKTGSGPCVLVPPPCQQRSGKPQNSPRTRRKASPNIQCHLPNCPTGSNPNSSHDCLSQVSTLQLNRKCTKKCAQSKNEKAEKIQRSEKRCRKCQHKLPCLQYPDCKLSSESLKKSPETSAPESPNESPQCSPARSPKASPGNSPRGSPKECPSCSSQESPKASPASSPQGSPRQSPQCSPQRSPKGSPRHSPQGSQSKCPCHSGGSLKKSPPGSPPMKFSQGPQKKVPKPPKPEKPCRLKPCNQIAKSTSCPKKSATKGDQYPWPTENQVSKSPSPTCLDNKVFVEINKCKKNCPMLPKCSNQSLAAKKEKGCKPDCANRRRRPERSESMQQTCLDNNQQTSPEIKRASLEKQQNCPEKQRPQCPPKQQKQQQQACPVKKQSPICPTPPKKSGKDIKKGLSGLFLRMKPTKKSCSKECMSRHDEEKKVVRLNSHERITISMKQETPSTEELREGMNIKVRDDDGNTLFERKDYTCSQPGQKHRPSVLGDMYKDSNVNRASTPVTVLANDTSTKDIKQQQVANFISEASIANLIEIQLKLRVTQGDKTTEISIADEDEQMKQREASDTNKTEPEVYVVENEDKEPVKAIEDTPKNDISIKIIVKNYKPKSNKTKQYDNDFAKKISEKFQTVSTGYSDVHTEPNDLNAFSIHRATLNLDSEDKFKTVSKPSNEMVSEELTEPINFIASSHSTDHLATDVTEDETVEISMSSKKDTQSYDKYDYTNELDAKDLESDQDAITDLNTSNECIDIKYNAKEEKKELLKKVFEKAYKMPKNKENVRQLRDSLKIILTDSSDIGETNINELAKDVTYTSLKPDFFKNTDSMTNYYKMESFLTVEESKVPSGIKYPTRESTSTTDGASKGLKPQGCMCSRVAERLNCDLKIGCCCKKTNIDEITSCDITNDNDTLLVNYRTEYVNVETQKSKHLTDKCNSINLSMHSRENYSAQNETDKISIDEQAVNTAVKPKAAKAKISKTFSAHKIQACEMKKLNRNTVLGISDDDKIILLKDDTAKKPKVKTHKRKTFRDHFRFFKASDVLQCYETKKAVLEIYAEKTVSENGEHFVAKLPKFLYEKESEITRNYEQIATNSYKTVCQRNVFRMTVNG